MPSTRRSRSTATPEARTSRLCQICCARGSARFLDAALADDPVLDHPQSVLAPLAEDEPAASGARGPGEGTQIGPYRLEGQIGEGGMGRVYRARRADGAFQQTVAVKVVRTSLALAGADVSARLRRERDLLAALDHPGIARLLDGGETDDGVPYLVTEFVDGAPITAWADARGLGDGGPRPPRRRRRPCRRPRAPAVRRPPRPQARQRPRDRARRGAAARRPRLRHREASGGGRGRGLGGVPADADGDAAAHAGLRRSGALRPDGERDDGGRRVRPRRAALRGADGRAPARRHRRRLWRRAGGRAHAPVAGRLRGGPGRHRARGRTAPVPGAGGGPGHDLPQGAPPGPVAALRIGGSARGRPGAAPGGAPGGGPPGLAGVRRGAVRAAAPRRRGCGRRRGLGARAGAGLLARVARERA